MESRIDIQDDENHSRVSLFLVDALEDLRIEIPLQQQQQNHHQRRWTKEVVVEMIQKDSDLGGLEIANALIYQLESLNNNDENVVTKESNKNPSTTTTRLKTWEDIFEQKDTPAFFLTSKQEMSNNPLPRKLEILLSLATKLQQRRLKKAHTTASDYTCWEIKYPDSAAAMATAPATKLMDETTTTAATQGDTEEKHQQAKDMGDAVPVSDPASKIQFLEKLLPDSQHLYNNLTDDEIQIVEEYYFRFKHDYEQRRRGMIQRLEILKSNLGPVSSTLAKNAIDDRNRSDPNDSILTEAALLEHFSRPHSTHLQREAIAKSKINASPLIDNMNDEEAISDRGGRLETESRVVLPTWES